MRGNIKDPWLNLFLRVLTILGGGALLFVSVVMLSPADDSLPGNAEEIRTAFVSYETTYDALLLYAADDDKPYSLSGLSGYEVPLPEPDRLCSGEVFSVFICEEKKQYEIYSIAADDGLPVISAHERNQAVRSEQFLPGILELIFGVICVIYGVFGIIVGRHPERFPRWIRKFCYKDPVWSETAKRKYGL